MYDFVIWYARGKFMYILLCFTVNGCQHALQTIPSSRDTKKISIFVVLKYIKTFYWTCFIKPFTDHVHLCQTTKFYSTINLTSLFCCSLWLWMELSSRSRESFLVVQGTVFLTLVSRKHWNKCHKLWEKLINLLIYFQWFEGQGQALGWEAVRTVEEQEGEIVWGAERVGEAEEEGVRTQHHEVSDQGLRDSTQVLHHWPWQSGESLSLICRVLQSNLVIMNSKPKKVLRYLKVLSCWEWIAKLK